VGGKLPNNFENRAALVGAEIARIEGRDVEAMPLYEQAIRSARTNGFIHNEALANELAARFYAARGFEKIAHAYVQDARYCYLRWGAAGKVRQLDRLYAHLREEQPVPGPTSTIGTPVEHLDLATAIKVSQAVSGEIVLEKLLDTLMRTAIEHAGAERGLLIVPRGAELRIEADATTSGNTVTVRVREGTVAAAELPQSVLHYVVRTQESVILDDASAQSPFSADTYLGQSHARSVLCLPLIKQGTLIGVLYLENTLTPHVFTPARIAVLKLLASQAAISLENTRLYSDLQEREAKIRRLVDSNIIGILMISDLEGGILEANDAFLEMVGYSRDDLVSGQVRWLEMTPAEWLAVSQRAVAQLRATGSCEPFEKEYFRKDSSRVPVLIGAAAFERGRDESVAFVLDLTERKRTQEALGRSERQFRALFEEAAVGIALVDSEGRPFESNRKLQQMLGYSANELRSMPFTAFTHPDDAEADWTLFTGLVSGKRDHYHIEKRYLRKDGALVWGDLTVYIVRDDRGEPMFSIGMVEDITERKRTEESLRQAQAELAHVTRVTTLGELVASIAHEVNQPLAAVTTNGNACLRWLARDLPNLEEARECLRRITRDGNRAGDVIAGFARWCRNRPRPRRYWTSAI
jgi:PAS domain S-box-containing protein